ncbi:MAG: rod shape-determining protein MreD [Pseudomonadota bacterium]
MTDASPARLWAMRAGFAALVLCILFFQLLPQQMVPRSWAGPDWVMLFAFAWAVRRPELVPPLLLGGLLLLSDLLLGRPPGLWAVLALLGAERLKARALSLRDSTLAAEIVEVSITIVGVVVAYQLILAILLVGSTHWMLSATQALSSLVAYPLVVLITHSVMGVRKSAPGDLDAQGGRL